MKPTDTIPFHKPHSTGKELAYIAEALANAYLAGGGPIMQRCQAWLQRQTGCALALLTHSCTAALEMAALLLEIQPNDEIILPSYTFVSTASAFVMRGGVPVFIDIRSDTLNIDETLIESAITPRTRAIVVVHYAGVSCHMDPILKVAKQYGLAVVEDAAHGIMASYQGKPLGCIGDLGSYSFHATKNIISGEGGCLLINDPCLSEKAEIIREKGTNRMQFLRGEVDKYTWQMLGSSFLPGELTAAFLWAQLEEAQSITQQRINCWEYYQENLQSLENQGLLHRPTIPPDCRHNAHLYYLLLAPEINKQQVINTCRQHGIELSSHYIPLHYSPAGKKYGKVHGQLKITESIAQRLIRLPLWVGLKKSQQQHIINILNRSLKLA